jgi:hypothetical protein
MVQEVTTYDILFVIMLLPDSTSLSKEYAGSVIRVFWVMMIMCAWYIERVDGTRVTSFGDLVVMRCREE